MATSGYKYESVKNELMKFESVDVRQLANTQKKKACKTPGAKLFWIFPYDPRVPHPRKIISKNYKYIESHPVASKIFPRKNLVAGSKRLPNLGEILAPTVQTGPDEPEEGWDDGQDGGGGAHPGGGGAAGGRTRGKRIPEQEKGDKHYAPSRNAENGSYHCIYHKRTGKFDVCSHMVETKSVVSNHFKVKHTISGHNVHLPATEKIKLTWFVYLEEDTLCGKQYVGSTNSMTHRWANTKLQYRNKNSKETGLEEHVVICRMGTMHQPHGLNSRDEIKRKSRCTH